MKKLKMGNSIATNSIILTFVTFITTALGIAVTKLLSVNFSLQEYGTYTQAMLVITTMTSLSILGLTDATNFFYNRESDPLQQKAYVSTIFTIQYVIGIVCAMLVVVGQKSIIKYFSNERLSVLIAAIAFTPVFQNLIRMYQILFVSVGRAKALAVRNLLVSLIRLVVVIIACFIKKNILIVLYCVLLLDVLQTVYFAFEFSKERYYLLPQNSKIPLVKEILKYSVPMSIYILTNSLSRDIDKYVVSAFSNTETLAIYSNASKILPFDILTSSMLTVLVPVLARYISRREYKDAKDVFKLYLRISFILTTVLVGGALSLSKNLMLFLYDEKYISGLGVFSIYLFIDLIRFANITAILSSAGKTKILMTISTIILILNAIMNVIAFKLVGMVGPAITTLVLTAIMVVLLLHFGARTINCRVTDLFDSAEVLIVSIEVIGVGAIAHYCARWLELHSISNTAVLMICYASYLIVLALLNYRRVIKCFNKLNIYK